MRNNRRKNKSKNSKNLQLINNHQIINNSNFENSQTHLNSRLTQHHKVNQLSLPHKKVKYCPIISLILKKNNKKLKIPVIYSIIEFMNFYEKLFLRYVCKQWNEAVITNLPFLKKENFINCVMNKNNIQNYMYNKKEWSKNINNLENKREDRTFINPTDSNSYNGIKISNSHSNSNSNILASYKKTSRKSLNNIQQKNNFTQNNIQSNFVNYHSQNNFENNIRNNIQNNFNQNLNNNSNNIFNLSDQKYSKKNVLVKLINSKNFNTIKNKVSLGEMTKSRLLNLK